MLNFDADTDSTVPSIVPRIVTFDSVGEEMLAWIYITAALRGDGRKERDRSGGLKDCEFVIPPSRCRRLAQRRRSRVKIITRSSLYDILR